MVFVMLSISKASEERIAEVLEEVPDIQNPENPVKEVKDGSIRFESVRFQLFRRPRAPLPARGKPRYQARRGGGHPRGHGARQNRRWCSSSPAFTTSPRAACWLAAWTCAITISKRCATPWPWCCKRTCFSGTIKDNLRWGNPNATDEEMIHACRLAQAGRLHPAVPRQVRYPHRAGRHERLRRPAASASASPARC